MKKSISKIMTIVLAFAAAICFVCAITMNTSSAKADGEQIFSVVDAQVYAGNQDADNSGIRFVAQVNKAAYDAIEKGDSAVFFGIELSVAGKTTVIDVCFNVAGNTTGQEGFNVIDFSKDLNEYRATLMYDAEQLAADLQKDSNFNPDGLDLENYKKSAIFADYMQAAYETEITATAYYQIGDKTVAEKHTGGSLTCSIWGVASKLYADLGGFEDYATVEEKYFNDTATLTDTVTVNEYGTITGYEFDGTEKAIYLNGKPIVVEDNKISTDLVEGVTEGEILAICVIDADGKLINLNAKFDMLAETISTLAYYDAAENVIYYNDETGTVQKITEGDLYYVGAENVKLEKGSVSYWYNDAFEFKFSHKGVDNYSMLTKVAPRVGEEKVEIAYNPATDVYTGVSIRVENDGMVLYNLSNVLLVSQVIDDAAELKSIFNKKDNGGIGTGTKVYTHSGAPYDTSTYTYGNITKGMYVLVDDIDASTGFTFDNSYFNFFEGVFDGRGHNIHNLNVSGTADKHGNGLFSAISTYASIQNVGFIDVKADNGAVFMGNTADRTNGTYYNSPRYREQVGLTAEDADDSIKTVLASVKRAGENYGLNSWSNVYVKVSDDTTKLMGVISRNMPNKVGVLRAANMVIEYNPTDASAYNEEGNGKYGVLFGAAYSVPAYGTYGNIYYDAPAQYVLYDGNVTAPAHTYYTPSGTEKAEWGKGGALNFSFDLTYNTGHGHTIYVYSPVKLVSCVTGSILGTNEEVTETNPYKFMAQNTRSFVNRYDNRDTASGLALAKLNAYLYETAGMDKYFVVQNGHFVWKNLPAKTPAEQA